jgi:hypothetical protein
VNKTHRTAIVLVPPKEVWPPIQAIRQVYDRHFLRWMPHITLIYPFRLKREWTSVIVDLTRACADVNLFEVELARFAYFSHRSSFTPTHPNLTTYTPIPRRSPLRRDQAACERVHPSLERWPDTWPREDEAATGRTARHLVTDPVSGLKGQPDLAERSPRRCVPFRPRDQTRDIAFPCLVRFLATVRGGFVTHRIIEKSNHSEHLYILQHPGR